MLWDVHAHLDDASFDQDIEGVLRRAGDMVIVNAGQDHPSNVKTLQLAARFAGIRASLGYHPTRIGAATDEQALGEVDFIRRSREKIVGISEIGLDYKYDDRIRQKGFFHIFLSLAEELDLPVIVHSRRAAGAVLEALSAHNVRVVLHAFSGNDRESKKGADAGYHFSLGPNMVYSQQKRRLARLIPIDLILTESDSPVLGPVFGERNEPANVAIAISEIAAVKGISAREVEQGISKNARHVFRI